MLQKCIRKYQVNMIIFEITQKRVIQSGPSLKSIKSIYETKLFREFHYNGNLLWQGTM